MNTKNKDIKFGTVELDPDEFLPHNVKVRVTTFIDDDVLSELKAIAEKKKTKYQTLLNSVLKSFVENSSAKSGRLRVLDEPAVRKIVRDELKKKTGT